MPGSRYGRCPGCRRQVLLLRHAVTGRVGLIEPAPHRDGTFRVVYVDGGPVLEGTYTTVRTPGDDDAGRLHRSHFVGCPVDRRPPRAPRDPADEDDLLEEGRCCHACGFRLHADLFRPGTPAIYAELHPLCVPDDRLPEIGAPIVLPRHPSELVGAVR